MRRFFSKFASFHKKKFIVMIISFLVFIGILIFSSQLIILWSDSAIKKERIKIETAIQQELVDISKQREEIASSRILNDALKNSDSSQLLGFIENEVQKRRLDFIVVTDKDGFVLARSGLSVEQGDNIFQTTLHGVNVALGGSVTSIVREVANPLTSVSGSVIIEQNKTIGSIFVGHIFNTAYANRFKEEHLKTGGQIIFYTAEEGVVGDSLNDKDKTQLINTYFSLGSDLVVQNLSRLSKEIRINGDYYAVRNIVFSGIEGSPGGAFLLFPIRHGSYSIFLASSMLLLFLTLLFLFYLSKIYKDSKRHILFFTLVSIILFITIYFITLIKLNNSAIELKKSPYIIYNSIIKLEPESDVISQYSQKTIAIKVYTGGENINAASVVINYDPKVVEILDIVTTNSFCKESFFIEKEINKEDGKVRIVCGIPNPGFSEPVGTVAELLVQPLDLKPISLEFTEETQVLANDGLGTNVLRLATNGYYEVVRQKFATADISNPIPIFSPSHPNSNRWYKNRNIKFSWPELSGGTYYYSLSENPVQSKEDKIFSTISNYIHILVSDGIYYFHLQAKDVNGKAGKISSFKVRVDSMPPSPPLIKVSDTDVKTGDIVRLDFTSDDKLSGLQSGFYVKINEGIFLPVKPPFYIPFMEVGEYPIVIRAFDKANNFNDAEVVINVSK